MMVEMRQRKCVVSGPFHETVSTYKWLGDKAKKVFVFCRVRVGELCIVLLFDEGVLSIVVWSTLIVIVATVAVVLATLVLVTMVMAVQASPTGGVVVAALLWEPSHS